MRSVNLRWIILAAPWLLTACGHKPAAETPAEAGEAEVRLVRVRVAEATEQVADETLAVTGSIFAGTDVTIAAKIGGKVVAIGADDGENVAAGRVLVRLDDRAARASLDQAVGILESARATLAKAKLNQGIVDTQADTGVRSAEADLAAARARLSQAEENYKISRTRSGGEGVDVKQAEANVAAARARLAQAQEALRLTRDKVDNDLTSAEAGLNQARSAERQAQAAVAQAETALQLTDAATATALENARQAVNQAQSSLAILQTGSRAQERRQAESAVAAARANAQTARTDLDRAQLLFDKGAIAKAQLDQARLRSETATEQLQQAEAQLSLVQEGPRAEEVAIGQSRLRQAEQQLQLAQDSRTRELDLRSRDLERAKAGYEAAKEAVRQAEAGHRTAQSARGQASIAEKDVAQAEQGLSQAEQAARLAAAGIGQEEIARQEVLAAKTAVASAEQRLRMARSQTATPRINQQDIRALEGQVRQAEAAVRSARIHLDDHRIVSPLTGGVASKSVEVGEVINPGQPLYRIVSDRLVRFDALVPEEKVRFVTVGDTVEAKVDAVPDRTFTGRVVEILPAADLRSRTFTVKVGLENATGVLREGMFARGSIVIQRDRRSLTVPVEAVVRRGEQTYVVRLEGPDRAVPLEIGVGETRAGAVEVTSGDLAAGDRIVIEGAAEIERPQAVKVLGESG